MLVEGKDLKFDREIDLPDIHPVGHRQHAGREVENAGHAGRHEPVRHRLCGVNRRRDHGDVDSVFAHHADHVVNVVHHQAANAFAHPRRVRIEQGGEPESARGEPGVPSQRVAEVPDADQRHRPSLRQAEHGLDLVHQHRDVVPDPPGSVRAEVGQVLAQLR